MDIIGTRFRCLTTPTITWPHYELTDNPSQKQLSQWIIIKNIGIISRTNEKKTWLQTNYRYLISSTNLFELFLGSWIFILVRMILFVYFPNSKTKYTIKYNSIAKFLLNLFFCHNSKLNRNKNLSCKFTIGSFDLFQRSIFVDIKNGVVIGLRGFPGSGGVYKGFKTVASWFGKGRECVRVWADRAAECWKQETREFSGNRTEIWKRIRVWNSAGEVGIRYC